MNARLKDKQAAYLKAMGREPEADPRGPTVIELRPPGADEADEVSITFNQPRRVVYVRGKTTRRIVADICRDLGRTPAQVIATATRQGGHYSAWIKDNDGPDLGADGGHRLAFVTGLTPTVINIVLGHPIERVEQVMGRFYPLGSGQAKDAQAAARQAAGLPAAEIETLADDPAETIPEAEISGDDE